MLHEAIFLATCLATMTTEKHCKLQRGCHTLAEFFRNLQRPRWKYIVCNSFSASFKSPVRKKTGSGCLIFTELRCRLRWICHTQQLQLTLATLRKVEDISTFLATRSTTFCFRCRLHNWGVTREILLATCLAMFVARQVARKIASCNMAFRGLIQIFATSILPLSYWSPLPRQGINKVEILDSAF